MKKPAETTLAVLKEIRRELRANNGRFDAFHQELRGLRGEFQGLRGEVHEVRGDLSAPSRRVFESGIRTATALTELAGTVRELTSCCGANTTCARDSSAVSTTSPT
jgi:hypothetical protein